VPRPHTTMRKIRDVLRQRLGDQLSLRQVSLSLAIPHATVADYVRRALTVHLRIPTLPIAEQNMVGAFESFSHNVELPLDR
jgi:predicted AAA+ superfamily ATPase